MENYKRYILVGFMGAGKTFLGKQLAERLRIPFIDSDKEIESQTGSTINQIFEKEGEDSFRLKEQNFIKQLKKDQSFVLATGGGLPCYSRNMDILNDLGTTIYLKLDASTLANRLMDNNQERPLIEENQLDHLTLFIKEKLAVREQFYNNAEVILKPEYQTLDGILEMINNG
jgi:shikimate kinase